MSVYTVCYDELYVFDSKEKAKDFFGGCYYASEGAEQSRYASILIGLDYNNIADDGVSKGCKKININVDGDDIISCELENKKETNDAIKYYQANVLPVLIVANDYGVDFLKRTPFEHFDSDEETDYMTSFSKFYNDILHHKLQSVETVEKSDGKYEMKINNQLVIDIRAWDNLKNVVDNVETIKDQLHLENDLIIRPCYFFNVGVTFDINDFDSAYDVWGCNGNACRSDIINGLSCENYGINFNEDMTRNYIKEYVKRGCDNTYGYMIKRNIELPQEEWEEIDEELVKNYGYDDLGDAKQNGFIPFDLAQLEDCCSYYEQPDESYLKAGSNLLSNKINIYNTKTALENNYNAVSKILKDIYDENVDDLEM